jgi:hypothetical protein
MAIAKIPQRKPGVPTAEAAAAKFIGGAGTKPPLALEDDNTPGRKPVMIRFDPVLLARVDKAAKRSGISRSAWVQYTLSQSLREEGDD